MRNLLTACILILMAGLCLLACKHEPQYPASPSDAAIVSSGFPDEIGKIFVERCATAGCHNAQSYENSAGLQLDSWENLFNGSASGAVVIPFSSANSSLLFYINPDSSLGLKAEPLMPLNSSPLTKEEYLLIKKWVDDGAPDRNGNIPFASNAANRQKIYITNQGCDIVGVVDAEKKVIMRYIPVGATGAPEVPHYLKASSDGYVYISFIAGTKMQKIDTRTDKVVGELEIGTGSWNAFLVSDDGKKILLGDFAGGYLILIDAMNMKVETTLKGMAMSYPHGIVSDAAFNTFYVTSQYGNTVYKFSLDGSFESVSIDGQPASINPAIKRNPHEIIMVPDRSKYFLTCDASNEIRVMDVKTDKVIDSINVGIYPQTMTMSKTKPYLFVTCSEDNSPFPGFKGSVYVIDYNTNKIVKRIDGPFFQPHGISVDDRNGLLYIANRNIDVSGPAPHHASSCGGRNGYYLIYDLNTLERLPKRYEVSVDPYSSDARFDY
ncbi:MAG TPA: hypothetical protein VGD89_10030 [Flavipsychrobacter sp.]